MHRFFYFFALSVCLLTLDFLVFSAEPTAHAFPTSKILTKTHRQLEPTYNNYLRSLNNFRYLQQFLSLHNNLWSSIISPISNTTSSDFSEFSSATLRFPASSTKKHREYMARNNLTLFNNHLCKTFTRNNQALLAFLSISVISVLVLRHQCSLPLQNFLNSRLQLTKKILTECLLFYLWTAS